MFVDTPIEECEKRDVKGLYAKARHGRGPHAVCYGGGLCSECLFPAALWLSDPPDGIIDRVLRTLHYLEAGWPVSLAYAVVVLTLVPLVFPF